MTFAPSLEKGLRALLEGLIDYAGMFPPANLPLEAALANFQQYRAGEDAWMLSGFILPVDRVDDAAHFLEVVHAADTPVRISLLGKGGPDWISFFSGLDAEIERIAGFRQRLGGRVEAAVFETRLPGAELDFQIRADSLVAGAAERLAEADLLPYFEIPPDPQWQVRTGRALEAIAGAADTLPARFKLRTGGVEAPAFPSTESVAWALTRAGANGLAIKCTAGLHHPIRRHRVEVGTKMHGFINVFAGAILSQVHRLTVEECAAVLAEEEPERFSFSDAGIAWNGLEATTADVERLRRGFAVSFGSCNFDEPREELRELGWL